MSATKKFKSSTVLKKQDIKNLPYSFWTPTTQNWRDVIEDYIYISKRRSKNKFAMFKLQIELLGDIVMINDGIKELKKLLEDEKYRKEKFEVLDDEKATLEYWEQELNADKVIRSALLDVGDGIAWRVLDFDRSLIYSMCVNNESAGPLTLNQGLVTEMFTLADYTNKVETKAFIYHGITNFLLISDLTIVQQNGDVNFVEVKSGNKPHGTNWKERLERQKEKVENIKNIANEAKGTTTNVVSEFRLIDKKPQTFLDRIDTLLKRVGNREIISQIFNSYLGIVISNFAKINKDFSIEKPFDQMEKQIRKKDDDVIIFPNSVENMIFTPNRAPVTVHPFEPEDIANILLGKYLVNYFFNVTQFMREIEKMGWKVSDLIYERKDNTNPSMFAVSKEKFTMYVPPLLTSRAIYEGLSVTSLVEIFEDSLHKGPSASGYVFYGFEKEKYLWN